MRKATRVKEPPCAVCGFDGWKWCFELKPLIKQLVARCFLSCFAGVVAELISKEYVDNVQYRTNPKIAVTWGELVMNWLRLSRRAKGGAGNCWRQLLAPTVAGSVDGSIGRAAPLGKQCLGINGIESVVGATVVTVHINRALLVDHRIDLHLTELQ